MATLTNISPQRQYVPSLLIALDPGESTEVDDVSEFEGHPLFETSEGEDK